MVAVKGWKDQIIQGNALTMDDLQNGLNVRIARARFNGFRTEYEGNGVAEIGCAPILRPAMSLYSVAARMMQRNPYLGVSSFIARATE